MEDILMLIDEIENNIIIYNLNQFKKNVEILIDKIINYLPRIDEVGVNRLNEIFYYMNSSLTNKDYMLYLDILQYELRPIIKGIREE